MEKLFEKEISVFSQQLPSKKIIGI